MGLVATRADITRNGFQAGAPGRDTGGVEIDGMLLVYRVTLPVASR